MEFPFDQKTFLSFFNLSSELMAVLTEDGRFWEVSPAWEKSLGFRHDELISIPFFDLIYPEDLSKTQLEIRKFFTNLRPLTFENRLRRKDQTTLWFRWTCFFSREEGHFYLTGQDISELKETGKALEENRSKFKRLTESTNEGIAVHDKAIILEANLALAKMFGYEKPEELVGLSGLDFAAPEYRQLILNNILSGSEEPYEVIGIRKDGTRFNCLLSGRSIQYQGRPARVSTFLDITKIKKGEQELFESQELFRKLAEASKDGIAVSERGVVLMANPALAQMFGYELSEMIGRNALEFTAPDFRETLLKKVTEEAETTYEVMGLRKNGTRFPVEITPRMTTYQGRRVRLGFFRDITQRKKIEEEVLRQKEFSQNMINSSTDGLLAFDPECRYTLWNPAMERISGHSREEVLGQCAFDVFPFLKQIGEDAHFYGALEGKTSFAQERPYRTPAGRQGFFEAHYMPIKNAQSQILGGLAIIRDITERKKTEEALRQSEQNLKAVFQNTFQNIVLMDREGRIRAFNTNAAADIQENTGKDLEIGRFLSDYVHPENAELLKRNLSRALQGEPVHLERTYRMGDGEPHWFELNYHPVFGNEGEIEGICMTSLNIDDRKKSEEAVQKSEADLRAIFNSGHQLIILVGRNGKIRDFNQNAKREIEELLGLRLEIGRPLADYVEPEFVKAFQERLKSVFKGELVHLERKVRNRDGQDAWFEFAYNPVFDRQGKVTGACLIIASIDGRKRAEESLKESEEKFRRVFEKASIGMTLVDKNSRFTHVNRAFCDFLGYAPQELVGKTFQEVTYPDEISQSRAFSDDVKNGKGFQRQKRYLHKSGSVLWANLTVSSFLDEKGELLYSLGMVEDITQRKLAEEALRKSEEELRAFFNSGSQVTILIRPDGKIQGYNKSAQVMAQRVLGRKIEKEMLFAKTLPPGASLEMFQISFNAALEGRESKGERSILAADGRERWVEVKYQPVFNDWDGVDGVCFSLVFIDERKKAEEALRESQERFERLTQVTQEGVLLHENPTVVDVNPALAQMMGYSAEEMIGRSGFDFLAPESQETARRHMVESSPEPYEVLALRKDGSVFPIELQGRNFHYKGKELRVLSVTDLTWRKETERILRASEEKFRKGFQEAPLGVIMTDKGILLEMNQAFCRMVGYSPDELKGKHFDEITHPEDIETCHQKAMALRRGEIQSFQLQKRYLRKDGTPIWVNITATKLAGGATGQDLSLIMAEDIDQRKRVEEALRESEEGYRGLVESSPDAVMVHDGEHILYVNSAGVKIFGAKGQEEMAGKSIWDLVDPEYIEVGRKRVLSIFQDRRPTAPMEQKWRSFNGRSIEVEVKGIPLMYRGRPAVMAIIRDVTESKKNHQTLLRYERLAAVGKVIAAIAHDVRNPLTVLSGMSQILTAKLEARKEYSQELKTILAQADRLKYFMNDILDYSREMEIRRSEIDPRTVLEESLVVAQSQVGAKQGTVVVEWKCDENLPRIFADGERLEQVIVNLVVNAYQAVDENGHIRLSVKVKDGKILLDVEDDGPGISEADMPRLFEPFFTTKRHGSGLGLSISQKIAEAHGGRIDVERLKPHGTKFIVELPLEREG